MVGGGRELTGPHKSAICPNYAHVASSHNPSSQEHTFIIRQYSPIDALTIRSWMLIEDG